MQDGRSVTLLARAVRVANETGADPLDITALARDRRSGATGNYRVMVGSPDGGGARRECTPARPMARRRFASSAVRPPSTDPVITSAAAFSVAENAAAVGASVPPRSPRALQRSSTSRGVASTPLQRIAFWA